MARKRKKSLSQQVVGVAAVGMPAPVKKIMTSRIGALLLVLAIPVLLASGIVTVQWQNGRPKLSVNQERAAEVKEDAKERLDEFRNEHDRERPVMADYVPHLGEGDDSRTNFAANLQQNVGEFQHAVSERFDHSQYSPPADDGSGWGIGPVVGQPSEPGKQAFQPFHNVREKIEELRR
jgi:hypothetical protein